ncbi:MAG TPA: serine hydrolase domain-containing protein [Cyclobacteriaceae bacterium]|jgi:CubicO group peptidase (beta-lactamase class C family)|nr:serine hydrolase domain-containing protein [Cyclobacteriaceae bacterium]
MKAVIKFIVISVFLLSCNRKEQKIEVKTLPLKIDSLFAAVPDFSGVVLVADKGKPVYHKAFGFTNVETKQNLDTTSIFELASVSKQFTAMLIAMLQGEGKLNYDDQVEKYLPELPYKGITIRHLLTHTSGLPDYQQLMDEKWDKSKVATNEDILSYLKKFHPASLFKPGEKYEYSNTGYVLLGSIVEKASGKDFVALCRERIFDSVGMTSTNIRTKKEKDSIANFALGYIFVSEKNKYVRADSFPSSNYTIWLGGRKGPGRISSTTSDLLKWDRALHDERLVNAQTMNEIFSPVKLNDGSFSNYGFGWMLRRDSVLGKIVYHSGDNPGYKTEILRYIDRDKTVIVLCNNAHAKFDDLIQDVEHLLVTND